MKLQEMTDAQLNEIILQLERTSKNHMDKYKRWEATQKLKLAQAEQRKRNPIERVKRGFMGLFKK
ncbi:MAG: hypothetical protein WBC91_04630 [Phototrophicaceae bacterium]